MSGPSLNPFALPSLGMVLDGPAKPKKRSSPNIKNYAAKLTRVAKKAPEVVVKVSGSGKRSGHILGFCRNRGLRSSETAWLAPDQKARE